MEASSVSLLTSCASADRCRPFRLYSIPPYPRRDADFRLEDIHGRSSFKESIATRIESGVSADSYPQLPQHLPTRVIPFVDRACCGHRLAGQLPRRLGAIIMVSVLTKANLPRSGDAKPRASPQTRPPGRRGETTSETVPSFLRWAADHSHSDLSSRSEKIRGWPPGVCGRGTYTYCLARSSWVRTSWFHHRRRSTPSASC